MLFKTIIFSDVPVLKGFKYRDRFQLVPFFYSKSAPISEYARHFPAFLEFEADAIEEELLIEDKLKESGLSEDTIKKGRLIPNQERVKREILQLLTCLTNYHFFSYDSFIIPNFTNKFYHFGSRNFQIFNVIINTK